MRRNIKPHIWLNVRRHIIWASFIQLSIDVSLFSPRYENETANWPFEIPEMVFVLKIGKLALLRGFASHELKYYGQKSFCWDFSEPLIAVNISSYPELIEFYFVKYVNTVYNCNDVTLCCIFLLPICYDKW